MVIATPSVGPADASAATSRSTAASASRSRQTSNGRETVRSEPPASRAALVFAPPMSTASVAAAVAGMPVGGVIDLKGGVAVHAVRGERERYRPVRSAIGGDDGDALALARGFRDALGLEEIYVADLDAIVGRSDRAAGSGHAPGSEPATGRHHTAGGDHTALLRALASEARLMVDAGVTEPAAARGLLGLGARRVIVGTETLAAPAALNRLLADLPNGAVILSLDLREGRVLSPNPQLAGLSAP